MKEILLVLLLFVLGSPLLAQVEPGWKRIQVSPLEVPAAAKESGLGGTVRVAVTVDERGNVISVGEAYGPDWVCEAVTRPDVLALREAAKLVAAKAKLEVNEARYFVNVEFPSKAEFDKGDEKHYSAAPNDQMTGKGLSGGAVSGRALKLPQPTYPPAAKAVRASGAVDIQVLIDEEGKVFSSEPKSGHPLLRMAARQAACGAEFSQTRLEGKPVKVLGIITFNFEMPFPY